jgi:hypothetical protein
MDLIVCGRALSTPRSLLINDTSLYLHQPANAERRVPRSRGKTAHSKDIPVSR